MFDKCCAAPILSIGSSSLVAISTLTSEINFYTRLIKLKDPGTGRCLFTVRSIELACEDCKEKGIATSCVHMLHLVPRWHSEERHRKLKIMMQDRPDLLQSEMQGLAFDSLETVFRPNDIKMMMDLEPLAIPTNTRVFIVVDPAAGGPQSEYAIVSIVRVRGTVNVIGIDVLAGCKEPDKQFALLQRHISKIQAHHDMRFSEIVIMVERNLGFEAEHHERALRDIPNVRFRVDRQGARFGILTTEEIKYAAMTLLNNFLRDQRVAMWNPLLSEDPEGCRKRMREQLSVYSFQYKAAQNVFGTQRVALSGKVGGMKDDVVIALQLALYFSKDEHLYM